ncbi:MAG: glycosyl hydrolase family 28-related protein, partial [Prolixibacteraceae bacterium]
MSKPPYSLDNTGKTDCSDAIIQALDDILTPTRNRQKLMEAIVKNNPDTIIGFEINPKVGVIFPDRLEPSKILYFPNGIYKITKKIEYTLTDLQNTRGAELNRQIHFQGQSEKGVVFKLADHSPGFEEGKETPVISFMKGEHSNIAMSNTFENITIDIGAGNPGATGLHFYANNTGAVRNVTIRSSDEKGKGAIGLAILKGPVSGCLIKNLTVNGFDYGVKVADFSIFTVFEHINLNNQKKAGFWVIDNVVSIRGIKSTNAVPALQQTGKHGMVCILDSELQGLENPQAAIVINGGYCFARNIGTSGYAKSIETYKGKDVLTNRVNEFYTHQPKSPFNSGNLSSLQLPIEETPVIPWEQNFDQWANVAGYGALADGKTDATSAIQKAMNSGKKEIYFQPGKYVIDSVITVPASVERINFMFTDLIAGENLKKMNFKGAFKVTGESTKPL